MKKIIELIKDLPRQWKAETPKVAKRIRNIAAILTTAIPIAYGGVSVLNIDMPQWFGVTVGVATFVFGLITAAAGTKEKK